MRLPFIGVMNKTCLRKCVLQTFKYVRRRKRKEKETEKRKGKKGKKDTFALLSTVGEELMFDELRFAPPEFLSSAIEAASGSVFYHEKNK